MSIRWMNWVWAQSPYSGTRLLIHLALADHAHDDGWTYPGHPYLAAKGRCSEEHVRTTLKHMEEAGLLVAERRGGGRGVKNGFQLQGLPPSVAIGGRETPNSVGGSRGRETPNSDGVNPQLRPAHRGEPDEPSRGVLSREKPDCTECGTGSPGWVDGDDGMIRCPRCHPDSTTGRRSA